MSNVKYIYNLHCRFVETVNLRTGERGTGFGFMEHGKVDVRGLLLGPVIQFFEHNALFLELSTYEILVLFTVVMRGRVCSVCGAAGHEPQHKICMSNGAYDKLRAQDKSLVKHFVHHVKALIEYWTRDWVMDMIK